MTSKLFSISLLCLAFSSSLRAADNLTYEQETFLKIVQGQHRTDDLISDWRRYMLITFPDLRTIGRRYRNERISYYRSTDRKRKVQAHAVDGRLFWENGVPISRKDTQINISTGIILVMDPSGRIYILRKKRGSIHHSTPVAGRSVSHADMILLKKGMITEFSCYCGHYRPTAENRKQFDFRMLVSRLVLQRKTMTEFIRSLTDEEHSELCRYFPRFTFQHAPEIPLPDPNAVTTQNIPFVVYAAMEGDDEFLRKLLSEGGDPKDCYDKENKTTRSALAAAITGKHLDVITTLIATSTDLITQSPVSLQAALKVNSSEVYERVLNLEDPKKSQLHSGIVFNFLHWCNYLENDESGVQRRVTKGSIIILRSDRVYRAACVAAFKYQRSKLSALTVHWFKEDRVLEKTPSEINIKEWQIAYIAKS